MSGPCNPFNTLRAAVGYQPAMQRPRCGNCTQGGGTPVHGESYQCRINGFGVSQWSVCNKHEFKRQGAATTPGNQLSP